MKQLELLTIIKRNRLPIGKFYPTETYFLGFFYQHFPRSANTLTLRLLLRLLNSLLAHHTLA